MASRAFARFLSPELFFMILVTEKKIFCKESIRIITTENYVWRAVYAAKSLLSWASDVVCEMSCTRSAPRGTVMIPEQIEVIFLRSPRCLKSPPETHTKYPYSDEVTALYLL